MTCWNLFTIYECLYCFHMTSIYCICFTYLIFNLFYSSWGSCWNLLTTNTKYRFSLDNIVEIICWILHNRLGKSSSNSTSLLHEFCVVSRGLFPNSHMQLWGIQEHHSEPWSSLHYMGHPSETTSKVPRSEGLQENGFKQQAICSEVQEQQPCT